MTRHGNFAVAALLGITVLVISFAGIVRAADPPAVGAMAPEFTLTSQEGKAVSRNDFKGKWVVLYFYPKNFTNGCTIEAHGFQVDIAKYQAKNATVVGVSVDGADSHKEFCAKEGLDFTLLSDTDKKVSAAYGSLNTAGANQVAARNTFILDPQGKIAKVFLKVQPTQHSAEVLAALDELQKK